jgi:hypothetical protein
MILRDKTIEAFGHDPLKLKKMSGKKILCSCEGCSKELTKAMSDYNRKKNHLCLSCSKKANHADTNSGYHSESFKKTRSEIAVKSNKNRKTTSEKFKKYLPYLERIKNNEISFIEVAAELGVDDSTVCKFFHSNFGIKSTYNSSTQEKKVLELLNTIFPQNDVFKQVRYSQDTRHKSDFFITDIGHIEYDGNSFFHQNKKSDTMIDSQFNPIRLDAQAYHGGEEYLRWKLNQGLIGYCAVKSPKEYVVKLIDNRKDSTKMLENCHSLGNCAGTQVFGLYFQEKLIGVAKFGLPTDRYETGLELRRFFVLDGTPRNTESYFLRKCELQLRGNKLITYIHAHEKGSYLKALSWNQQSLKTKDYDCYIVNGKIVNKRKMFGWAKKTGLVEKFGTTGGKEMMCTLLNGEKITEPSKIKFVKQV